MKHAGKCGEVLGDHSDGCGNDVCDESAAVPCISKRKKAIPKTIEYLGNYGDPGGDRECWSCIVW